MGYDISVREIEQILTVLNNKALIICTNYNQIKKSLKGFEEISLGISLADKLIRYPGENRSDRILEELDKLVANCRHKKIIVKDIDILFNPDYKIDVLKYFANISRVRKVVVVWNGTFTNGYLQYSENGYLDYKRYLVKNYDVICVT